MAKKKSKQAFDPRAYCDERNEAVFAQKAERVLMAHEKRAVQPFSIREREEKLADILTDLRTNSDPMRGVRENLWGEYQAFVARACAELGGLDEESMWAVLEMAD